MCEICLSFFFFWFLFVFVPIDQNLLSISNLLNWLDYLQVAYVSKSITAKSEERKKKKDWINLFYSRIEIT